MLDIKIETFLTSCKYMNFTKAAQHLHITQSAVSQQIKGLEEYYGTKLFVYEKRTLALTQAGKYLRSYMQAMYNDSLRLKDSLKNIESAPTLKIGATMSVGDFFMPKYIAKFLKNNKNTKLCVTRLDTKQILNMLDMGELDFAVVEGNINKKTYYARTVSKEKITIACSSLIDTRKINNIEDLTKLPLLIRESGSGTREVFLQAIAQSGYSIDSFERYSIINSPTIIKELLLQGGGVSAIYNTVIKDCIENKTLKEIKIDNFNLSHDFYAIWRKESVFSDYYEEVINKMFFE